MRTSPACPAFECAVVFGGCLPRWAHVEHVHEEAAGERLRLSLKTGDASGPVRFRVLDIGCGNGVQTIELARQLAGDITAVDNHQPFLDELRLRA